MAKNNNYGPTSTDYAIADGSERCSLKGCWEGFLQCLGFHSGNIVRECPYCSIQCTEVQMVRHLEQCQQVTHKLTRPDGFSSSVTYAGPNRDIRESIRQINRYDNNNLEYHH